MDLQKHIRDIPNHPKPGIIFKDITPLLKDHLALNYTINKMSSFWQKEKINYVVGVEARGFILGAAVAHKLGCGFIPVRKKGKLPWKTVSQSYELEYGQDCLEMHQDSLKPNERVLIVDDLLATGGTMNATIKLVESQDAIVIGLSFIIELSFLNGREQMKTYPSHSLITY